MNMYDEFLGPDQVKLICKDGSPPTVVSVPSIEGFDEVAELPRQAGAEITDEPSYVHGRENPTVTHALALARLVTYEDGTRSGNHLSFRYEDPGYVLHSGPTADGAAQWRIQARRPIPPPVRLAGLRVFGFFPDLRAGRADIVSEGTVTLFL